MVQRAETGHPDHGHGPVHGIGHDHGHDTTHAHGHGHHHHHAPADFGRAFAIGIGLNGAYVIAEAGFGIASHSLSLVADAGHNFGDVLSLAMAWVAARLARRPPSGRYTYGLRGSSILAALANAVVLLIATGAIAWESVQKLLTPGPAGGLTMIAVAAAGVAINGVTALMFAGGRGHDVNLRAAFAHMLSDALVALGVVAAGGLILLTGWTWLDPAASLVISGLIVMGTWSLMQESLDLALQAVPSSVNPAEVLAYLEALPGVSEVHDLHIWGMSTTETALTAHLVRPGAPLDDAMLRRASDELRHRFSVHHVTLQVEQGLADQPCELAPSHVV